MTFYISIYSFGSSIVLSYLVVSLNRQGNQSILDSLNFSLLRLYSSTLDIIMCILPDMLSAFLIKMSFPRFPRLPKLLKNVCIII